MSAILRYKRCNSRGHEDLDGPAESDSSSQQPPIAPVKFPDDSADPAEVHGQALLTPGAQHVGANVSSAEELGKCESTTGGDSDATCPVEAVDSRLSGERHCSPTIREVEAGKQLNRDPEIRLRRDNQDLLEGSGDKLPGLEVSNSEEQLRRTCSSFQPQANSRSSLDHLVDALSSLVEEYSADGEGSQMSRDSKSPDRSLDTFDRPRSGKLSGETRHKPASGKSRAKNVKGKAKALENGPAFVGRPNDASSLSAKAGNTGKHLGSSTDEDARCSRPKLSGREGTSGAAKTRKSIAANSEWAADVGDDDQYSRPSKVIRREGTSRRPIEAPPKTLLKSRGKPVSGHQEKPPESDDDGGQCSSPPRLASSKQSQRRSEVGSWEDSEQEDAVELRGKTASRRSNRRRGARCRVSSDEFESSDQDNKPRRTKPMGGGRDSSDEEYTADVSPPKQSKARLTRQRADRNEVEKVFYGALEWFHCQICAKDVYNHEGKSHLMNVHNLTLDKCQALPKDSGSWYEYCLQKGVNSDECIFCPFKSRSVPIMSAHYVKFHKVDVGDEFVGGQSSRSLDDLVTVVYRVLFPGENEAERVLSRICFAITGDLFDQLRQNGALPLAGDGRKYLKPIVDAMDIFGTTQGRPWKDGNELLGQGHSRPREGRKVLQRRSRNYDRPLKRKSKVPRGAVTPSLDASCPRLPTPSEAPGGRHAETCRGIITRYLARRLGVDSSALPSALVDNFLAQCWQRQNQTQD